MTRGEGVYVSNTEWTEMAARILWRLPLYESEDAFEWSWFIHQISRKWSEVPKSIVMNLFRDSFEFGFHSHLVNLNYEYMAKVSYPLMI